MVITWEFKKKIGKCSFKGLRRQSDSKTKQKLKYVAGVFLSLHHAQNEVISETLFNLKWIYHLSGHIITIIMYLPPQDSDHTYHPMRAQGYKWNVWIKIIGRKNERKQQHNLSAFREWHGWQWPNFWGAYASVCGRNTKISSRHMMAVWVAGNGGGISFTLARTDHLFSILVTNKHQNLINLLRSYFCLNLWMLMMTFHKVIWFYLCHFRSTVSSNDGFYE